jgi:hypothetical protein
MEPLVRALLERAASENGAEQNEAILQLALLLEKSAMRDKLLGSEPAIQPQLRLLSLSVDDIREIVAGLGLLIESEQRSPSMLWALGKAKVYDAALTLLEFLKNHCQELEGDMAWQALVALDNWLVIGEDGQLNPQLLALIRERNPTSCLVKIIKEGNPDLSMLAQRILGKLHNQLN